MKYSSRCNKLHKLRLRSTIGDKTLHYNRQQLQRIIEVNQKCLETVQKLLELKLITNRIDLLTTITCYKIRNIFLRIVIKIV